MPDDPTAEHIKTSGLVAIVRGAFDTATLTTFAQALLEGGVDVLEITLNTSAALHSIAALRRHFERRMLIGAGTVRTVADADAAIKAGAQFLIGPTFDASIATQSVDRGVLYIPGVLTPTEVQAAVNMGCRMVKLFPADLGGPSYLKALRAPLDDVDFMPTGGITVENVAAYARAGAVAVGLGSSLITGPQQSPAELAERARALRQAWQQARP